MSTELDQRLARLAPEVDVDAAREALRARRAHAQHRRNLFAATSVLVVAAGLVVVLAAPWHGGDMRPVHVVGSPTTTVTTTTTPALRTTTARGSGVEVRVTAPDRARAGTRAWFDAVVRNVGTTDVLWQAGGCAIPVEGAAGPLSAFIVTIGGHVPGETTEWNGDVRDLGQWVADHHALGRQPIQREDDTGRRDISCPLNSVMEPLRAGGELHYHGSFEARVAPGPLVDQGTWNLEVSFTGHATAGANIGQPLGTITARAPVAIVDDPNRKDDGAAIYRMNYDPRLQPWLDSTVVPDRPDLQPTYRTELSWWRGAWELWIWPHWQGMRALRMRYDPVQHKVVDVRSVYEGKAPDDEPGAHPLNFEPDEVIPLH
jgi:hypothetical protein